MLIACNGKTSPVGPTTTTYQLTLTAGTGGTIVTPASSTASVASGVATAIKAHANAGYSFARWVVVGENATVTYLNSASTTAKLASGSDTIHAEFISMPALPAQIDISAFQKEQGANFSYFKGTWTTLPDFSSLTPDSSGPCDETDISLIPHPSNNFGVVFNGYLNIPIDGNYTFYLKSSDGSTLLLNDSVIINNDGIHLSPEEDSGTVSLTQGYYLIAVKYFNASSSPLLAVSYSCPDIGIEKTTITKDILSRPYTGPVPKITISKPVGGESFHLGDTLHVQWIYKNPRGQVFVSLSADSGKSYQNICAAAIPGNVNSYNWQIPLGADSLMTKFGLIMVEEYPPFNLHGISKRFSIVAP
jgi:hypothetical protein